MIADFPFSGHPELGKVLSHLHRRDAEGGGDLIGIYPGHAIRFEPAEHVPVAGKPGNRPSIRFHMFL
jgi:hypothetical protein